MCTAAVRSLNISLYRLGLMTADLFTSADSLQKLCDQEAAEIVTYETRQVLKGIVAEQDELLEVAIDRMMEHQVSKPSVLCSL
jgi:hypothetical protein